MVDPQHIEALKNIESETIDKIKSDDEFIKLKTTDSSELRDSKMYLRVIKYLLEPRAKGDQQFLKEEFIKWETSNSSDFGDSEMFMKVIIYLEAPKPLGDEEVAKLKTTDTRELRELKMYLRVIKYLFELKEDENSFGLKPIDVENLTEMEVAEIMRGIDNSLDDQGDIGK